MYAVIIKPLAIKVITALDRKRQRQVIQKIESLAGDPRPRHCRQLNSDKQVYRIRSGDFRIIYQVRDRQLIILVAKVGDRRDVYRNLGEIVKNLQKL